MPTSTVHVYWINNGTNILLGEGQLWDFGPGHPCPGHADIIIDPEFALVANMFIVVTNLVDGTSDFTLVLPATPTPIAPP